jgi:hypothetical protein
MSNLREDAIATKTEADPTIIQRIEEDIKNITIAPCKNRDPSLGIARMVVQECWREVVFIFLYMVSLCIKQVREANTVCCRLYAD